MFPWARGLQCSELSLPLGLKLEKTHFCPTKLTETQEDRARPSQLLEYRNVTLYGDWMLYAMPQLALVTQSFG